VKPAVDTFMADKPDIPILLPDKSGSVVIAVLPCRKHARGMHRPLPPQ
jgi:hypothetical protein